MKKALIIMVLLGAILAVNAQPVPTKTTEPKVTTTIVLEQQAVSVTIDVADLLKAITDNITKDFAAYSIKEASRISVNSMVTFEVVVVNETETENLLYDNDGLFLKKMEKVK